MKFDKFTLYTDSWAAMHKRELHSIVSEVMITDGKELLPQLKA